MANTELHTTTAEVDARLVHKDKDRTQAGFKLIREWPWIDATVADTLSVTLDAVKSYTSPPVMADGEAYTGTFVNSRVEVIEDSRDGERAAHIRQTLVLVADGSTIAKLKALPAIVTQENEILNLFEVNTGERDLLAFKFSYLNPAHRDELMTIADATYVSDLANVAAAHDEILAGNVPATGWSYEDRKCIDEPDKTMTFIVLFRQTAWTGTTSEAAAFIAGQGTLEEHETIIWPNVSAAQATTAYDNAKTNEADMTAATPASPASHKLKKVTRNNAGEGRYRVERVTFIPKSTSSVWLTGIKNTTKVWYQFTTMRDPSDGLQKRWYRAITVKIATRQVITRDDADDHIDGGLSIGPFHSRWWSVGPGKYIAVKITLDAAETPGTKAWVADTNPA